MIVADDQRLLAEAGGIVVIGIVMRLRRRSRLEAAPVDRQLRLAHRAGEADLLHRELRLVERERLLAGGADDLDHGSSMESIDSPSPSAGAVSGASVRRSARFVGFVA